MVGAAEGALQQDVLLPEQALLEGVADLHLQLVDVERLAEIIVSAQAHGLDGGVCRSKGGDHDAENVRVDALRGAKHVNTRHVGHLDVRDQQVEPPRFEIGYRRSAVFGQRHIVTFAPQDDRQQLAHRSLVVHDEELRTGSRFRVPGSGFGLYGSGFVVREFSVQRQVEFSSFSLLRSSLHAHAVAATALTGSLTVIVVPRPGVELTLISPP